MVRRIIKPALRKSVQDDKAVSLSKAKTDSPIVNASSSSKSKSDTPIINLGTSSKSKSSAPIINEYSSSKSALITKKRSAQDVNPNNFKLSDQVVQEVKRIRMNHGELKTVQPRGGNKYRVIEDSDNDNDFNINNSDDEVNNKIVEEELNGLVNSPHQINFCNTPTTPTVAYEKDFVLQDLEPLKIPLVGRMSNLTPYVLPQKYIRDEDLLINKDTAMEILKSRCLFYVLQRKRHPIIMVRTNKGKVSINAHFYLVKHMVYNLLCEEGFSVENSYDQVLNDMINEDKWENGPVFSNALKNQLFEDRFLRNILIRDHGNIKDQAKKKVRIVLPSLLALIPDFEIDDVESITRPVTLICYLNI